MLHLTEALDTNFLIHDCTIEIKMHLEVFTLQSANINSQEPIVYLQNMLIELVKL